MEANHLEGGWLNGRGHRLYTLTYKPSTAPKACLMFHHGYGEHCARYMPVFEMLAKAGIAVHAYDAHGHGRSEPQEEWDRHLIWDFQHMVDDWAAYAAKVRKENPGIPFFIGGHSMGALTSVLVVLRDQSLWQGLCCCSATVDVEWNWFLRLQASVGGILAAVIPRARIVPAVRGEDMNADPQAIKEMEEDPLNSSGNVRARTANEFLKAFRRVYEHEHELHLPIYAHHGAKDRLANLLAVKRMLKNAQSRDITLHEIPGGYHEVMMGAEREDVTQHLIDWITSKVLHSHLHSGRMATASSLRASFSSEDTSMSSATVEDLGDSHFDSSTQQPLPPMQAGLTGRALGNVTMREASVLATAPLVVSSALA